MTIIGIIVGLSIPLIRNIQEGNKLRKYEIYSDSLRQSAKLYINSYGDDLFGNSENGCVIITLEQLMDTRLAKDIKVDDLSCNSSETKVQVLKKRQVYIYH